MERDARCFEVNRAAVAFGERRLAREEDGDVVEVASVGDLGGEAFGRVGQLDSGLPVARGRVSLGSSSTGGVHAHEATCRRGRGRSVEARRGGELWDRRERTWNEHSKHVESSGRTQRSGRRERQSKQVMERRKASERLPPQTGRATTQVVRRNLSLGASSALLRDASVSQAGGKSATQRKEEGRCGGARRRARRSYEVAVTRANCRLQAQAQRCAPGGSPHVGARVEQLPPPLVSAPRSQSSLASPLRTQVSTHLGEPRPSTTEHLAPRPAAALLAVAADADEPRRLSPPLVPTPAASSVSVALPAQQGMQNRHSFKHIPSTPNFIVPDGTAHFDHLPEPSPVSTLPPPSGAAPALSGQPALAPGHPPSPDYFTSSVSDKYPPVRAAAGPAAGRSSVHVPLLARDTDDDDMSDAPYHSLPRPGGGGPGAGGRAPGGLLDGLLHSRLRLHPLALVPALMAGVVLALSGIFGPTLGSSRSNMVVVRPLPLLLAARGTAR